MTELRPPLDVIAAAVEEAAPALAPAGPLQVLGHGFSSLALATASGAIVRIAQHAEAAERHAREARLLPHIAPLLPVPIPVPEWWIPPSPGLPFGAHAYRKLPGIELVPADISQRAASLIARQIGAFQAALHRLPLGGLPDASVKIDDPRRGLHRLRGATMPALRRHLTGGETAIVNRWWADLLADDTIGEGAAVLSHGDLWYGNLLVLKAEPQLAGVVDWEHASIGDAAKDLATHLHMGIAFTEQVLAAYADAGGRVDPMFRHRLQRAFEAREFYGVRFAARYRDAAEMADSVAKLRRGPILNRDAPRLG